MTTLEYPAAFTRFDVTIQRPGILLVQANDDLWRVTRTAGDVLGYIERFVDGGTDRFRAKRLMVLKKQFHSIGEFWSIDDAIDCFRFS
jgi:hypothetical protein